MMMSSEPSARDFAIECLLSDWEAGRADRADAERLRDLLRQAGDVVRLERVARRMSGRG